MTTLLDCGHTESPHSEYTTGYGMDSEGKKHCWECCAIHDINAMRETGRYTLYLCNHAKGMSSPTRYYLSNWPGTLTLPVRYSRGKHNMAGTRIDVWFNFDGHVWHGVQYGEDTMICHVKRTKQTACTESVDSMITALTCAANARTAEATI